MIREQQEPRERRCPACGQGTLVARVIRDEFEYGPEDDRNTIVAEGVPVLECPACGETLYGPDAARVRHQAICRALGLLTPEQIKGVREKLGKKQTEFAALTGIGVATLSRWEQGRLIQTRALDRYLRLLQWEENVQRLRDLEEGTNAMPPPTFPKSPDEVRQMPTSWEDYGSRGDGSMRAKVRAALSKTPQSAAQIAAQTGVPQHQVWRKIRNMAKNYPQHVGMTPDGRVYLK